MVAAIGLELVAAIVGIRNLPSEALQKAEVDVHATYRCANRAARDAIVQVRFLAALRDLRARRDLERALSLPDAGDHTGPEMAT
jgi:hypothetical protein